MKKIEGGEISILQIGSYSLLRIGKRKDCMEGNAFLYIWKKSRFHLIDGNGREGGKFILHVSRNGCGRKVSFCRQGKYFGMISLHGGELTGHSIPR